MSDDDELRARLRANDPARTLPGLPAEEADRVLDTLLSRASEETTTESRAAGLRQRSPLTWLVAAAAAAVIGGTAVAALVGRDGPDPGAGAPATSGVPSASEEPGSDDQQPPAPQLSLPARPAARCMVPNARTLSTATYAVDAEAATVRDGVVTLEVLSTYAGEPAAEVRVAQGSADLTALIGAPRFEAGERYLVAGTDDGDVLVCGFSGPWTPRLARLYDRAFAPPAE